MKDRYPDKEFVDKMRKIKTVKEGLKLLLPYNLNVLNNSIREGTCFICDDYSKLCECSEGYFYIDDKKIIFYKNNQDVYILKDFNFVVNNKEMYFYKSNIFDENEKDRFVFFNTAAVTKEDSEGHIEYYGLNMRDFFKAKYKKLDSSGNFNILRRYDDFILFKDNKYYLFFDYNKVN